MSAAQAASSQHYADAKLIWDYHQLGHQLRPCSAGIGLGSHDLGVATLAADLYLAGLFPVLVFSGGNSPTTAARFPCGEAVHYAEHATALGVPANAIIIEPRAANTGQNIDYSRAALAQAGIPVTSVMLVSKPYMQRRAYATIRKAWPEAEPVCSSEDISFDEYLKSIGDDKLVIDMLVGDLQRVIEYPARGFAIAQAVPTDVTDAYRRLIAAGYDSRLMKD
ncbi:MAG: YdcF family protein [Trebonia sp.]